MCPKGDDRSPGGCKRFELTGDECKNVDHLCPCNSTEGASQLSTVSSMTGRSPQNLVYRRKRRKLVSNSNVLGLEKDQESPKRNGKNNESQLSTVSSMTRRSPRNLVYRRKRRKLVSNIVLGLEKDQESTKRNGENSACLVRNSSLVPRNGENVALQAEQESKSSRNLDSKSAEATIVAKGLLDKERRSSVQRILKEGSMKDSCSSSMSNSEKLLSVFNVERDEASECSSSGVIALNHMGEDLSEKEYCIRILKKHGLLSNKKETESFEPIEETDKGNFETCRPCKICSCSETTLKLLICDDCEDVFHMKCCKPRVKKVPKDEWFCHSCAKIRCQNLNNTNDPNRSGNLSLKGKYNSKGLLLRNNRSSKTSVRIGEAFQAKVPEWSGPIRSDDYFDAPVEEDYFKFPLLHDSNPINTSKLGPLNNWIQCREVLDGQKETICGKWRRAPLFEVQNDDWECFCCVRWDPARADCAVPQEIETDEVYKQLKYAKKLRLQLMTKWKNQGNGR